MSKILIVEDQRMTAEAIATALRTDGHNAILEHDPTAVRQLLADHEFDVALIDMLFRDKPDVSGLEALSVLSSEAPSTRSVLWTSAEENRMLHLGWAFSWFDVVGAIPKDVSLQDLRHCLTTVLLGHEWIHPELRTYRTPRRGRSVGEQLMNSSVHRAVWRALAKYHRSREAIAKETNYAMGTVAQAVTEMNQMLVNLTLVSPEEVKRQRAVTSVSSFALRHREFFLDQTVARLCEE